MSKLESGRPTTWRTKSRSRNARSLFMTGPMTWARLASLIPSYEVQNPPRPTVSSATAATRGARNASSERMRGTSARLVEVPVAAA